MTTPTHDSHHLASTPCPKCGRRELWLAYDGKPCDQPWACPTCGCPRYWHSYDECPNCRYLVSLGVTAQQRFRLRDGAKTFHP